RISPEVGANLARTLTLAGYKNVRADWRECPSDSMTIENMLMFYDEIRDRLAELKILTAELVTEQQRLLAALPTTGLPAVWGSHRGRGVAGGLLGPRPLPHPCRRRFRVARQRRNLAPAGPPFKQLASVRGPDSFDHPHRSRLA